MRFFIFIFILFFTTPTFSEHFRYSIEDYPNCSPIGMGGNKQKIIRIKNAKSEWGRDNVLEEFMINNKRILITTANI